MVVGKGFFGTKNEEEGAAVKYYSHHIGDFDRATRHLTRIERSVYRDLLDVYYDTEQQLTLDLQALCRKIEGITRGLKALAKELGIVIVLLSQLNRELEKRPNKRPQPSDLRDSGAIEQDADAVMFLYRDEVYNPDSMDKGICEVNVALCRQGAPGVVGLAYIGEHTRFESLATWEPPRAKAVAPRRGLAEHL